MSVEQPSGTASGQRAGRGVEKVTVGCDEVPTETSEESGGTLSWSSTALTVVELESNGARGVFSAHCAPAVSVHVCCAMETAVHLEHFYDHYRSERMLFEGVTSPENGRLSPDRDRPGLGLSFNRHAAECFAV